MNELPSVCLLNDSFPPLIDGVANTVMNYAKELPGVGYEPMVITPAHPQAHDDIFDYAIARYPSISTQKFEGYPAGVPFSPEVARQVQKRNIAVLHSHCPVMSTFMARQLRQITNAPVVFTYHTKFDIDIAQITKNKAFQIASKKVLASNISACDEVWVVSHGAGLDLRALGYKGDYIVMPNGVDLPCEKAENKLILEATKGYDLPQDVPVYLFVGRMMWYKGLRIILDALCQLKKMGTPFRMVFVGDGGEKNEVEQYALTCGMEKECIFTGAVRDRQLLRGWYSRADLFLFPSTYDTNGLVVREAAACHLPSVLIRNSCAAEGVIDGQNGFLIEENAESLAACLSSLTKEKLFSVGQGASRELYLSWQDAVKKAAERYQIVIDRYQSGALPRQNSPVEGVMKLNGELMEALSKISKLRLENIRFRKP